MPQNWKCECFSFVSALARDTASKMRSISVLFMIAIYVPFSLAYHVDAPAQTVPANDGLDVQGWTPKPTEKPSPHELLKRQLGPTPSSVCGNVDGNSCKQSFCEGCAGDLLTVSAQYFLMLARKGHFAELRLRWVLTAAAQATIRQQAATARSTISLTVPGGWQQLASITELRQAT
jgi:hypothetical protein